MSVTSIELYWLNSFSTSKLSQGENSFFSRLMPDIGQELSLYFFMCSTPFVLLPPFSELASISLSTFFLPCEPVPCPHLRPPFPPSSLPLPLDQCQVICFHHAILHSSTSLFQVRELCLLSFFLSTWVALFSVVAPLLFFFILPSKLSSSSPMFLPNPSSLPSFLHLSFLPPHPSVRDRAIWLGAAQACPALSLV